MFPVRILTVVQVRLGFLEWSIHVVCLPDVQRRYPLLRLIIMTANS